MLGNGFGDLSIENKGDAFIYAIYALFTPK